MVPTVVDGPVGPVPDDLIGRLLLAMKVWIDRAPSDDCDAAKSVAQ
jgi:hypothetical protein